MRVLIIYGTTEGQTREIAQRIGDWVQARGHRACILDSATMPDDMRICGFDAYVFAGSVHFQHHQASLAKVVKRNIACLQAAPSAFVSVSGTAVQSDEKSQSAARRCIDAFAQETGWMPTVSLPVGGAVKYTKYNFILRAIMKRITAKNGGPSDTSRDYDLTDWTALENFIDRFLTQYVESRPLKAERAS